MFINFVVRSLAGAVVALGLVVGAQAQNGVPTGVVLTPDAVENFIASFQEVQAKADELGKQYEVPESASPTAGWRAWAGVGGAKGHLDTTVGAHGFSDFNEWTRTFSVVAQSYAFAREGGALDSQLTEALEKIRGDPNIPEAQKEIMIQQLQHSSAAIVAMRPRQENIDAVKPYVDQLADVFDDNR